MKCLNLYAGIGGNRKLWTGCKVTAVEINLDIAGVYKELYPKDEVVVGDAHDYLLKHFHRFDFIWSSPPCQSHSQMQVATRYTTKKYPDIASLYQEIIFLKQFFKNPWVIENVVPYYEPLIKPTCQFERHLFWSNFGFGFDGINTPYRDNIARMQNKELEDWSGVFLPMGVYKNKKQILRNVVHPLMGQRIFSTAKRVWERRKASNGKITLKPVGFGF